MREFITIAESVQSEITEKKSKFIANLFYVENSEKAEKIIKEIIENNQKDFLIYWNEHTDGLDVDLNQALGLIHY